MNRTYNKIFWTCCVGLLPFGYAHAEMTNWIDPNHPISLTTSEIATVLCDGKTYRLGEQLLYVDGQLSDAEAGTSPYVFNDMREALRAAEAYTRAHNVVPQQSSVRLLIAPYVYWLDDPEDAEIRRSADGGIPYALELNCPGLTLVGLNPKAQNTVLAVNRGQTQGALGNYTMLHLAGDDLRFENLTFGNYCNVDLEYPLRPALGRARRGKAIVQAQLAICDGSDRVYARNCRFISRLNLCPLVGARRTLFDECYFESTDDALAGSAVYLHCRFTFFSSKPFYNTSETGAVFLGCHIDTHTHGTQYFTKVPGMVTFIDSDIHTLYNADDAPLTVSWNRQPDEVVCYQHGVSLNGAPYTILDGKGKIPAGILQSEDPLLRAYRIVYEGDTLYNIPNLMGGSDAWDPTGERSKVQHLGELMGLPLLELPVALHLTADRRHLAATDDSCHITAQYVRWGGAPIDAHRVESSLLHWTVPTIATLSTTSYTEACCVSRNRFDKNMSVAVQAQSDYGCHGTTRLELAPYLTEAPEFSDTPTLSIDKKAKAWRVDYTLNSSTGADRSVITWYRCPDAETARALCSDPERSDSTLRQRTFAIRRTTASDAGKIYTPTRADAGYLPVAVVTPRVEGSRSGKPIAVQFDEKVASKRLRWSLFDERQLSTDFHELPVEYQPQILPGFWTFDAFKPKDTEGYDWTPQPQRAWYYGAAQDAAVGQGLVQQTRGARLLYTPTRNSCSGMRLTMIVDPCKSGGQGFGSATGQYMELYIAYDAANQSGYGLRIERTPEYDHAVLFRLMKYEHGVATSLGVEQASSCYRTSCTIKLTLDRGTLSATATTTAELSSSDAEIQPEVHLQTTVPPLSSPGFGVQHTGTTGAGATLIHYLQSEWW
jgi:hypothetical protein